MCVYGHKGEEGGSRYIGGDGVCVCMGIREKREGVGILGEMVCVYGHKGGEGGTRHGQGHEWSSTAGTKQKQREHTINLDSPTERESVTKPSFSNRSTMVLM